MSDILIKNMKMPDKATTIVIFSEGKARVFRQDIDHDEWLTAIEVSSADVAEVKHGKWEVLESFSDPLDDSHKDRCRCTNCGFIHVFTDFHYGQYFFCPECGAKMDGG